MCVILSFSFSTLTLLLSVLPPTGSYGRTDFDPRTWLIPCWVTVAWVSSLICVASFCMWCVFTCVLMCATVRAPMCKGQKSPPVLFLRPIHLVFETGSLTLSWRLPTGQGWLSHEVKGSCSLSASTAWLLVFTHARQSLLRVSCFPASHPRGFF